MSICCWAKRQPMRRDSMPSGKYRSRKADEANGNQAVEHQEMKWVQQHASRLIPEDVIAMSDADGRFQLLSVPKEKFCWLKVEHPDYADSGENLVVTSANPPGIEG